MDQAARGATALSAGDFGLAIKHYTEAITQNSGGIDYYIKRSTAYTRSSPPAHADAFKDAEIALSLASKRGKKELITQSQMRRAIALYGLERYADSDQCFQWVRKLDEKEKSLAVWEMKIIGKLKGLAEDDERAKVSVKQIPDVEPPKVSKVPTAETSPTSNATNGATKAQETDKKLSEDIKVAQTPASKIRHDWIQDNTTVTISLYCKGLQKDQVSFEIKSRSLDVDFPLSTGSQYSFSLDPLFAQIDHEKSKHKIMSTKAEFTLVKAAPGKKWPSLEGPKTEMEDTSAATSEDSKKAAPVSDKKPGPTGPVYPTSSKSGPKNWDKVASDLIKRPKKDAKEGEEGQMEDPGPEDEEGDPANNFFKMLYAGADADTKKAMMKSYQESNGTALSTNWAEVSKGPVETSPPEGIEAKPWNP